MRTRKYFKNRVQPVLYQDVELLIPEYAILPALARFPLPTLSNFAETKSLTIRELPHKKYQERDDPSMPYFNELRCLSKDTKLAWKAYLLNPSHLPTARLLNVLIHNILEHIKPGQLRSFR